MAVFPLNDSVISKDLDAMPLELCTIMAQVAELHKTQEILGISWDVHVITIVAIRGQSWPVVAIRGRFGVSGSELLIPPLCIKVHHSPICMLCNLL